MSVAAEQIAFDLDELTRPPYSGPRVGYHADPLTLEQVRQIEEEARHRYGNFGLLVGFPHIWSVRQTSVNEGTPRHSVAVCSANLGCDDKGHGRGQDRVCSCVGGLVERAICECGWCSTVGRDGNAAVEDWHDHAWPGWRGLPVVPESVCPRGGGISDHNGMDKKAGKRALAWVVEHYPSEWQKPGAPVITERSGIGTRHVPGYSPWGGFDMSSTALVDVRAGSRDLPGLVHGIVSLDPPTVRCDGCGFEATGDNMNLLILTCGIEFNPRIEDDHRRLCAGCRTREWGYRG